MAVLHATVCYMGKSKGSCETILPTVARARYIIPQFR